MHVYRSPYRPLDLGWLPPAVQATWSYNASDIEAWRSTTRYAFEEPLPERFISQWSLVLVEEEPRISGNVADING